MTMDEFKKGKPVLFTSKINTILYGLAAINKEFLDCEESAAPSAAVWATWPGGQGRDAFTSHRHIVQRDLDREKKVTASGQPLQNDVITLVLTNDSCQGREHSILRSQKPYEVLTMVSEALI